MRCHAAQSTRPDPSAIDEVVRSFASVFGSAPADLAVAFASTHHDATLARLATQVADDGLARHFLGCLGEAIVTSEGEVEDGPALVLWGITLPPGSEAASYSLDGKVNPGQVAELAASASEGGTLVLLGDPFSFDTAGWLKALKEVAPGLRVIGGMASAGQQPGVNLLLLGRETTRQGAVAVLLTGPVQIMTVVSQGCRPIGQPLVITRAEGNMIRELGGRPALEKFQEVFTSLTDEDRALVRQGLHIGRVINEYQETFGRGDFLVRNVMGADDTGAIAITDLVRPGQTVQFHVRDAETASEDIEDLLSACGPMLDSVVGALLFTCNGRGKRLFGTPDHDLSAVQEVVGPIPVAGFFAMGELGPIGGQNFIHGFTASVALFREG